MIQAIALQTEYLKNPVGIDSKCQRLSWKVTGAKKQTAYEIRIAENGGKWVSQGKVTSDAVHMTLDQPRKSRDIVRWQVRLTDENGVTGNWSEEAYFEMGLLKKADWKAVWIMGDYDHDKNPKVRYSVDYFRKEILLTKKVAKARLYITACGMYVSRINGQKVGDQVLTPGATAFQRRAHYQVYDLTGQLQQSAPDGRAVWEIALGDGFYASRTGVFGKAKVYGYEPKVIGQLELTFADGTKEVIETNHSFSWSNDGAVRAADMKDGEIVDYRSRPSYSGQARETAYEGMLCASNNVPVQEMERFTNPKVISCPDGKNVLDFGQNIAGYMEVSVQGKKGHKCSMVFGERLDEKGNFSYTNISWEGEYDKCHFQRNDVICDGKRHIYKPEF